MNHGAHAHHDVGGQWIGVLAADERAHRAEGRGVRPERIAPAAGVDQPLAHRGDQLLVLAEDAPVGADVELGVEHGAGGVGPLLAQADHRREAGVAAGAAQALGRIARDHDGVLEQAFREPHAGLARGRAHRVPGRMRRNESLRKRYSVYCSSAAVP